MQLPVTGHPLHTRSLTVVVSRRETDRWSVRGDILDLRKCGFVPMTPRLQPAGIIHQMTLAAEVDADSRKLCSLSVEQPFVAIEASPATGGECCRDPADRLQALVGEVFDADFTKRLSTIFGGALGCSHLLTLFQLLASALPRGLDREAELQRRSPSPREAGECALRRSAFVEGFEAEDGCMQYAIQLHDFYTQPLGEAASPLAQLARHDEVRAFARVDAAARTLIELRAAERCRTPETLADAPWQDHDALLADFAGTPIMPGLAGRLFRALGDDAERRALLDALLQLAPGHIQTMAAVTDRWFTGGGPRGNANPTAPAAAAIGGFPDSCYMWRQGGSMQRLGGARRDPAPGAEGASD